MEVSVVLGGGAVDTLYCLFIEGPTMDGDVPSKSGRDELVDLGLADRCEGYQFITAKGIKLALQHGVDRAKEKLQRDRALRFNAGHHASAILQEAFAPQVPRGDADGDQAVAMAKRVEE